MKTLDPDYLGLKQFYNMAEDSDDFACAYVCVEFRFHLGHLNRLRLQLRLCVRLCLRLCLRR